MAVKHVRSGLSCIISPVAWWPLVCWSENGLTDASRATDSSATEIASSDVDIMIIGQVG
jgi:hypothetical protein